MIGRRKTVRNSPKNHSGAGQIRIIGGQHRGRKLPVHDVIGLRPTTDRLKETIFNWLMMDVRDAHVLDCFAGAGSLSFEALSRFACDATLLELDAKAAKQLQENAQLLKLTNAEIVRGDAMAFLQRPASSQFDLVFVDPPFHCNLSTPCCAALEEQNWLSDQALIYVEVESDNQDFCAPANWQLLKEKQAGQVWCRLYQRVTQA